MEPCSVFGKPRLAVPYVFVHSVLYVQSSKPSRIENGEGSFGTYLDVQKLYQQHYQSEEWKTVSPPSSVSHKCLLSPQLDNYYKHLLTPGYWPYILQYVHVLLYGPTPPS